MHHSEVLQCNSLVQIILDRKSSGIIVKNIVGPSEGADTVQNARVEWIQQDLS